MGVFPFIYEKVRPPKLSLYDRDRLELLGVEKDGTFIVEAPETYTRQFSDRTCSPSYLLTPESFSVLGVTEVPSLDCKLPLPHLLLPLYIYVYEDFSSVSTRTLTCGTRVCLFWGLSFEDFNTISLDQLNWYL